MLCLVIMTSLITFTILRKCSLSLKPEDRHYQYIFKLIISLSEYWLKSFMDTCIAICIPVLNGRKRLGALLSLQMKVYVYIYIYNIYIYI